MSNTAHDLTKRLLNALDSHYNVIDMHTVIEIISILEKITITKELLEATRLGKHVNELRRRAAAVSSSDAAFAALARRAKLLVKRWRDLVIPHNTPSGSDSAATLPPAAPAPHTSTMVEKGAMQGVPGPPVSPALRLLNPPPAYDSDSQDVILVDDEPPASAPAQNSLLGLHGIKRTFVESPPPLLVAPVPVPIDKKIKRDKKSKKKSKSRSRVRSPGGIAVPAPPTSASHNGLATSPPALSARDIVDLDLEQSRDASCEAPEATAEEAVAAVPAASPAPSPAPTPLPVASPAPSPPRRAGRKNGVRSRNDPGLRFDNYSKFLRDKLPAAGVKKVKTTKELLEDIQSRAGATISALLPDAESKLDTAKTTVPIIELHDGDSDDDVTSVPIKDEKPLQSKRLPVPKRKSPTPPPPQRTLESPRTILSRLPPIRPVEEEDSIYPECLCTVGEPARDDCPAARLNQPSGSSAVFCLHNAYVSDVNGTVDHRCAKETLWLDRASSVYDSECGVFANVVPRYKYLDYSEDSCVKNLSKVKLDRYSPAPRREPDDTAPFFKKHYDSAADTPFSEDENDHEVRDLCNGGRSPSPPTKAKHLTYGSNILSLPLSIAELNAVRKLESWQPAAADLSCVFTTTAIEPDLSYDKIAPPRLIDFGNASKATVSELINETVPETLDSVTLPSFREWHEPVSRTDDAGDTLCVLPYVVID